MVNKEHQFNRMFLDIVFHLRRPEAQTFCTCTFFNIGNESNTIDHDTECVPFAMMPLFFQNKISQR